MTDDFACSTTALLNDDIACLTGRRIGLLSHQAALDASGSPTADLLHHHPDIDLRMLLGPEHGYFGKAGAGEQVDSASHPEWGIPIASLYTESQDLSPTLLKELDVIVFDLSSIAVRAYTYLSSLARLLRAVHGTEIAVIIPDRPIPYAGTIDGPMRRPGFESFVNDVNVPFVYGMTLGEAARFIVRDEELDLELNVIPASGYCRQPVPEAGVASLGTAIPRHSGSRRRPQLSDHFVYGRTP